MNASSISQPKKPARMKVQAVLSILIAVLVITVLISLSTGRYSIPIRQLQIIFFGKIFGLKATWPSAV